jgi:16S rRNA processing protein RimM
MSFPESDSSDALVSVAKAVRTRGLKGEVVADLLTDFPERFDGLESLVALAPNGARKVVELEDFWFQNNRVVFKIKGFDDVDVARELIGYEFCVPETQLVELAAGEHYDFELEGCVVQDLNGARIGQVRAVLKTGGTAILVIDAGDGREVLVPLAESIVVKVDTVEKKIVVDPPEGLLEL